MDYNRKKLIRPYAIVLICVGMIVSFSCENPNNEPEDQNRPMSAQDWINATIEAHGGDLFNHSKITFGFRDRNYVAIHDGGKFQYERIFDDESGHVRDVYTNDGFYREINGEVANIPDSMKYKYTGSVNGVVYFALLPFKLNDPAVIKEDIGEGKINGKTYQKIRVSFQAEGGGVDFEDVFVYWINPESYTMDYLAYKFKTDGGGMRFRSNYNVRTISGIRFADYVNYEVDPSIPLETLDELFSAGKLKELSKIELTEVEVEIL